MTVDLLGVIIITKTADSTYLAVDKNSGAHLFTADNRIAAICIASCCIAVLNILPASIVAAFAETHIEWRE